MSKGIRYSIFIIILVMAAVLALPARAYAAGEAVHQNVQFEGILDKIVFGGDYVLKEGETLNEGLVVMGGTSSLESGSTVNGDILLMGGSLDVSGEVKGNISVMGGSLDLRDSAVVTGDISMVGGSLDRASGATVNGKVTNGTSGPIEFTAPGGVHVPDVNVFWSPIWNATRYFFTAFLVSFLAVLVAMFLPRQTERTARAAVTQPVVSAGLGAASFVGILIGLAGLAITIILIPVSFIGVVVLAAAIIFGWIALGAEVGQRLGRAFNQEWALPLAAGVGTLLVTLVADGFRLIGFLDCITWIVPAVVGAWGLGAVLLTRFGTQDYPGPGAMTAIAPPQSPYNTPDMPAQ